nr:MAG TPA: hypothetical protein [Caudoviricetes sp.]
MKRYEHGDDAKFYFVIKKRKGEEKYIKGYTDNKSLAKFYMNFHRCKRFRMKEVENTIDEIRPLIEENLNDEITIGYIKVEGKHGEEKMIAVPVTETEMQFIREESGTYMATSVDYSLIHSIFPLLRKKYRSALEGIFLKAICNFVINNRFEPIINSIFLDNLKILYRSFPDEFED